MLVKYLFDLIQFCFILHESIKILISTLCLFMCIKITRRVLFFVTRPKTDSSGSIN